MLLTDNGHCSIRFARYKAAIRVRPQSGQVFTGALRVSGINRQNLRSVPAVRWADSSDCVHHRLLDIRKILIQIGVESDSARVAPARGLPLWNDCDAQVDDGAQIEPDRDLAAQPAPDFDVDQRVK